MRYNILCIDETGIVKIEFAALLKNFDVNFVVARDGNEASNLLSEARTKYNAIIWALNYADLKDFGAVKKIKNEENARNIPLIIVSKFTDKKYIIRAIESGAVEYIVKPYDEPVTVKKLHKILGIPFEKTSSRYEEEDFVSFNFNELVNKELKSASRGGYPLSIVMTSVVPQKDGTYSQNRMNEIINLINKVLRTKLRETDTALHYGFNNLVLILPFSDRKGMETVDRKIRDIYNTHSVIKQINQHLKLVTAGICFPEDGRIKEKLLEKLGKSLEDAMKKESI